MPERPFDRGGPPTGRTVPRSGQPRPGGHPPSTDRFGRRPFDARDESVRPAGPPPGRGGRRPPHGGGPPSPDRSWVGQRQEPRDWPRPAVALPAPDLLGADEELVAGRRPVEEAFAAGRPALRLLVVPQRREPLEKLVLHATRLRIPIVELEGGSLTALAGFDGHQGVALVVEPRQFASLDDILARAAERSEPPFALVLDSFEDPQNVGTLLRSAEAAGVHGVIFPTRRQAPLTPAAIKASAGAVEHLLLCPVDDLAGALADLHGRGLRIAGSEADAPLTARQSDLRGPLAIVVGSEGQGLGPAVRRRCDLLMRIPMRGAVGSLNAAVAGSIVLFEAVAQRDPEGRRQPSVATPWPTPGRRPVAPAEPPASTPDDGESMEAPADAPEGSEIASIELDVVSPAESAPPEAAPGEPDGPESGPPAARPTEAAPAESGRRESGPREARAPSAEDDLLPGAPPPAAPRPKRARAPRKG
ncbi:MAG: 23S rRNA (guanosine(2251)-2'-O)-methyltransferase RlmB [Candidatus Limnocylindrales bacterium]|nr:23S rRNA (guanosine(2251)-2'-O)-methyltransferase RlmB [Candidatus Limnocylindrales bacterium]